MVDIRYPFKLCNSDAMSQVPDMNIEFYIDEAQFVTFDYQLQMGGPAVGHLVTTLILDGIERR